MQYSPSRDWTADPMDCPVSRYSQKFKNLVDRLTREAAAAAGYDLQANCPICHRLGTIAIGKKVTQIGNIFLNCKFCREVFDVCSLDMPAAARLEIHTARVEEVVAWKEREGPDEYLKLVEGRKSFTPIPATPDRKPKSPLSFEEKLSMVVTKRSPSKSRPLSLEDKISMAAIKKEPKTPPPFSPLPPSSIPSSQPQGASPATPDFYGTQHKGTADSPYTLLSPFITPESRASGSGSGSGARGKGKKRQGTSPPARAVAKKPRVDALRQLDIFFWFKDSLNYLHAEEIVGSVFSISEFYTLLEAMNLPLYEEFQVYYPNACEWCFPISMQTLIANYPEKLDAIVIRVDGVKECPGFHQIVGKLFKDM